MDEKRFPETTLAFQFLPHQAVDLGRHLVTKFGGETAAPSPKLDS